MKQCFNISESCLLEDKDGLLGEKASRIYLYCAFLLIFGSFGVEVQTNAQRGRCGNQTICVDPILSLCIPVPTTLPPVSETWSGGLGLRVASKNCGAKRCYWLFSCVCGPALSGDGFCNGATGDSCNKEIKSEGLDSFAKGGER